MNYELSKHLIINYQLSIINCTLSIDMVANVRKAFSVCDVPSVHPLGVRYIRTKSLLAVPRQERLA